MIKKPLAVALLGLLAFGAERAAADECEITHKEGGHDIWAMVRGEDVHYYVSNEDCEADENFICSRGYADPNGIPGCVPVEEAWDRYLARHSGKQANQPASAPPKQQQAAPVVQAPSPLPSFPSMPAFSAFNAAPPLTPDASATAPQKKTTPQLSDRHLPKKETDETGGQDSEITGRTQFGPGHYAKEGTKCLRGWEAAAQCRAQPLDITAGGTNIYCSNGNEFEVEVEVCYKNPSDGGCHWSALGHHADEILLENSPGYPKYVSRYRCQD